MSTGRFLAVFIASTTLGTGLVAALFMIAWEMHRATAAAADRTEYSVRMKLVNPSGEAIQIQNFSSDDLVPLRDKAADLLAN